MAYFRDIDIDAFDEEQFQEEEYGMKPEEANANVKEKANQVRTLLQRNKVVEALLKSLEDPPYGSHNAEAKQQNAQLIMQVLSSTKSTEINESLNQLNQDQMDILMKYVYYGMANSSQFNCAVLLNWHEKLTEIAGVGSIVRVLADHKTI